MADNPKQNFRDSFLWRSKIRGRNHELAHEETPQVAGPRSTHPLVCHGKPELVQTQEQLEQLILDLRAAGSFAYDSEFIGELYYVPKLCLLQIATSQRIALVDPLAGLNLQPFWELLCDPTVEKIVHAGPQDMEPALRILGRPAAGVIDTQIVAAFAGLIYPVSLQRLVQQLLGVKLGKGLTFTHWDQLPLSEQQLRYAADDVRYLPAVWEELRRRVDAAGTFKWALQECEVMCRQSPYQFDPQTSFYKVRGAGSLDGRQLGMLRELCIWRDGMARASDLPPRTLLKDEILIDLCRRAPREEAKLQNISGLPRPLRVEHGGEILAALTRGAGNPVAEGGEYRKVEELPEEQFRTDALVASAQCLCYQRGIDPQIVLSRNDVAEMCRARARGRDVGGLRLMQGWRREVVGDKLLTLEPPALKTV